mmetsp:Transcript_23382/g.58472  ORF Transcript_23382/g.58472 Transcript_23382/m.58472 type:complete len:344 (+) Transcript_23382:139-1170(+)|eukprot:CAMPEP_0177638016 /NCGR_PEP_ID=MMETSP0447-20121125/5269_1 /TAXON_ID=0 /ORGANISM="Stygamoeba regulata, Strain BSH-02190019" /LENGTH=343 /DNA_ID=CAMNT_0019139961 /DNA_START=83 /DNA_END=1114 /DNA_ORIENTATION=+
MPSAAESTLLTGLTLYCTLTVGTVLVLSLLVLQRGIKLWPPSAQTVFFGMLFVSELGRILWSFALLVEDSPRISFDSRLPDRILNRIVLCTFLSAFVAAFAHWVDEFRMSAISSSTISFLQGRLKWAFVLFNVLLFSFEAVFLLLMLFYPDQEVAHTIDTVNIDILSFLYLVISFAFVVYAIQVYIRYGGGSMQASRLELLRFTIETGVMCVCFLVRACLLFYRPITGDFLTEWVFYWFCYYIPEVVPAALQLDLIRRRRRREIVEETFIANLYEEQALLASDSEIVVHGSFSDLPHALYSSPRYQSTNSEMKPHTTPLQSVSLLDEAVRTVAGSPEYNFDGY